MKTFKCLTIWSPLTSYSIFKWLLHAIKSSLYLSCHVVHSGLIPNMFQPSLIYYFSPSFLYSRIFSSFTFFCFIELTTLYPPIGVLFVIPTAVHFFFFFLDSGHVISFMKASIILLLFPNAKWRILFSISFYLVL